jgi:hypothetical protein
MEEIWNPHKIARPDVAYQIMDKKLTQIQGTPRFNENCLASPGSQVIEPSRYDNVLPPLSSIDVRTVYLIQIYTN